MARYLSASRGYGPGKVRRALRQSRRLAPDVVDEAVGELDVDWSAQAREVARGKRVDPEDPRAVEKVARFLAGRGFPAELCWQAAKERVRDLEGEG